RARRSAGRGSSTPARRSATTCRSTNAEWPKAEFPASGDSARLGTPVLKRRQLQNEPRALPGRALDAEFAVHGLSQSARNVESEPGASVTAAPEALELPKYPCLLLLAETLALVDYDKAGPVPILFDPQPDYRSLR